MRITRIETITVGAGWKNWLFVRVHTDEGLSGIGEGTLNGFVRTIETAVHELEHLAVGQDPTRPTALAKRLFESVSNDGGHLHKHAVAAIETACWDILGKSATPSPATRTAGTAPNAPPRPSAPPPRSSSRTASRR
jgi:galactonate dehydratase